MRSPVRVPEREGAQISVSESSREMPIDTAKWSKFMLKNNNTSYHLT